MRSRETEKKNSQVKENWKRERERENFDSRSARAGRVTRTASTGRLTGQRVPCAAFAFLP